MLMRFRRIIKVRYSALLFIAILLSGSLFAQHPGSFEFAKRMYQDGFYQEAKLVFERIIVTAPTSPEAEESYYLLAEMNRRDNNFAEAENYYRTLYETFPGGKYREEALFNWALSQQKQQRYSEALETSNRFVQTFPASLKRLDALYILVDCHFNLANYRRVISISSELIEEHSTSNRVPDLMLLMAKSYLNLNEYSDGDNYLAMIIQRYPNSDARWESVLVRVERLKERADYQTAAKELVQHINAPDIPRLYEERLRKRLADYYLNDGNNELALEQLNVLTTKFDRSSDLSEYLDSTSGILIGLGQYNRVIEFYEKFEKDVQDTDYQIGFLIKTAEAYFRSKSFDKSDELIRAVQDLVTSEPRRLVADDLYALNFWKARIKEHNGLLMDAISDYQAILTEIPVGSRWQPQILMRMGDIYMDNLGMYSTAINYYNRIITGIVSDPEYLSQAMYKLALCYQAQKEYGTALSVLQQINTEYLEDAAQVKSVNDLTELLRRFKIVDYEQTTSKLVFSLLTFLDNDDKSYLRGELINVAMYHLNDVDSVISMLSGATDANSLYTRGKAYVLAIQRAILQKDRGLAYRDGLEGVIKQLDPIVVTDNSHKAKRDELLIEKQYIDNLLSVDAGLLAIIESYIEEFPNSPAINRFSFLAGYHYLNERIFVKADEYLRKATLSADIPLNDFENAYSLMASYFFENDQYGRAVSYYKGITQAVARPDNMYKYAISLLKTNDTAGGVGMLDMLIKNNADFEGVEEAVKVLAEHYQSAGKYTDIINTMILLPDRRRGDEFYSILSQAYTHAGDEQKAKESLMYIVDKDRETMRRLAELHFLTGDLIMAEHTYKELLDNEQDKEKRLTALAMLGHINYSNEKWQAAVNNYDRVISDIGSITVLGNLPLKTIAKETIISLYRISNRPKAESVMKNHKSLFDGDNESIAEIELNEGIYQMSINRNRADKSFNDIIRNRDYPETIKLQAYFWKGLNNLENKKIDEAYAEFKQAAKSTDMHLRNQALLKLGTISFSKEQFQSSLDYYYTVIRDDKTGELALDAAKNFAIVCKTIEEWQKAIQAYNIILEKGGEGKLEGETIFNIAYCHFRDRQYEEAVPMFERSITLLEDREMKAEAQYWIGESYTNLGQYDRAATEYLKVGYYYPDLVQFVATSEIKLSEAYIRQGRIEAARSVLDRIISKYGRTSDWGRQAVIILQQL